MKEVKFKEFIDDILNNNYPNEYVQVGIFDNFYQPFLSYMEELTLKLIRSKGYNLKFSEESLVDSILCSTKESLIEIGLKTLLTEFYDKKGQGLIEGTNSKEIYESYNESFKDYNNIKAVLDKYEVLSYLIYRRITTKYILIEEAITRLSRDIEELRNKFNHKYNIIESITLNNGDTHNNGKSVMIFNFDNNEKVVYKPHGLHGDEALNKIYEYINSKNISEVEFFNVDVINKEYYGWQKFISYEKCTSENEAETYFYKVGAILAILNVLKTTDIHSENIIASKDNPTLIDLETLITNNNTEGVDDTIFLSYLMEFNDSVLNCYLLPQNIEFSKLDIDIGGLSADPGKKSRKFTYLKLKDQGTDKIRFESEFVVTNDKNNKPMLNGKRLDPLDYTVQIESGFKEIYSLILNNKEEFLELLNNVLSVGVYRQVLRPTYVYAKYLQASYHPKYLKKFEDRLNLFNIIKECDFKTFNNNEKQNIKCVNEIEALMEDDIPYFESDFNLKTLYINSKSSIDNYFVNTIKEILTERVNKIDEISKNRQVMYIRNSILTTKKDLFHNETLHGENIGLSKDDIEISLRAIGDYIYNNAIFNSDKTTCTYQNLNMHGDRMLIGPIDYTLYDGSGLILFLYTLAKELNDEKYFNLAEASLKGLEEISIKQNINSMIPSAFSGIGSLVYLYYNLNQLLNETRFEEKYLEYINKLNNYEINDYDGLDVVSGAAGIIILASNIYIKSKEPVALEIVSKYSKFIYKKFNINEQYLTGFSHGYSGFSLALFMAADILKNEDYYKLAIDIIMKEDSLYNYDAKNWIDLRSDNKSCLNYWCHGAPGILLARSKMTKFVKDEDKKIITNRIPEALEMFLESGFNKKDNHSLCHGLLGNIDILRVILDELNLSKLNYKYDELFKKSLAYMSDDGVKYGLYNALGMVGFMTGISGIGYSILRGKNSKLPSVLALDVLDMGGDGI